MNLLILRPREVDASGHAILLDARAVQVLNVLRTPPRRTLRSDTACIAQLTLAHKAPSGVAKETAR